MTSFTRQNRSLSWRLRAQFLLYVAMCRLLQFVQGAPTFTSRATNSSTSGPVPTPTTSSDGDRDGSFKILADGTQDLAALVGLFATDFVEQYAVDYSKGYLSACASTLSLLGLLGWSRAMMKLGLGQQRCENAGFDTKTMRPIYGISKGDHLSRDETYPVCYIKRLE
ncbi:hypothetical protein MMC14_006315 [Varicellaria rhodocarpa]|nr:hypothetical protein [Varicellaria rhodocarpa]